MPFQPIVSQRLYQQVAHQIGDLIRRGEFVAGQRLPPERDLARLLGASRPVVREALVALEIAGLVEVRGGSGSYVKELGEFVGEGPDAGPSPFELVSARMLIEGETAFVAASEATESDLRGIVETLDTMRAQMVAGEPTFETDRLFHARIAAATRNTVLPPIVVGLWDGQFAPMFEALSHRTRLQENQRATLRDHGRIVDALLRHDGPGAREAMRAHLAEVMRVLMRDYDAEALD